jgi:hypothetical protein
VYELIERNDKVLAIPRHILMDGNGNETKGKRKKRRSMNTTFELTTTHSVAGFKCEWSTTKDDKLYIGSFGKEWTTDKGVCERKVAVKKEKKSDRIKLIRNCLHYSNRKLSTATLNG